jgi:subtilisin family serine protease
MPRSFDNNNYYEAAFMRLIKEHPDVRWFAEPGREFLYRPGQLLAAKKDAQRVAEALKQEGLEHAFAKPFAGMTVFKVSLDENIPRLVDELRSKDRWKNEPPPQVQPHHVTLGYPNVMGGPGGPPEPEIMLAEPDPGRADQGQGLVVGICDTGIWAQASAMHPGWLANSYTIESDDEELLYDSADLLGLQGGHGTFVAGVLRQAAPGAWFDPERALDQNGIGDERSVADAVTAVMRRKVHILNLSLGCFTQDDLPSLALRHVIDSIPDEVVIVAAAGNAASRRPNWPAAFERVIGVAAVTHGVKGLEPAKYSNYGRWVDACAPGEHVSTYVRGRLELDGDPNVRVFERFATWYGTSFAAPLVAGRIAAAASKTGTTPQQAAAALLSGVRWHPDYGVLIT